MTIAVFFTSKTQWWYLHYRARSRDLLHSTGTQSLDIRHSVSDDGPADAQTRDARGLSTDIRVAIRELCAGSVIHGRARILPHG